MLLQLNSVGALQDVLNGWRKNGERIAFVPTMGALHAGHMALVAAAKTQAERVVTSIFVNPTQFGPNEDFTRYPRQLEQDAALLTTAGCDALFAPGVRDIYPPGFVTKIDPGQLATVLEGAARPGHFSGVATVVTRLLMLVMPDAACFGEKDYQQLLIVRQTVRDLAMPCAIIGVPTLREADGLALSSRNVYLTPDERRLAPLLSATMRDMAGTIAGGLAIGTALQHGRMRLSEAGFALDYLTVADAVTLAPLATPQKTARILVAARLGRTRLIDNMPLQA